MTVLCISCRFHSSKLKESRLLQALIIHHNCKKKAKPLFPHSKPIDECSDYENIEGGNSQNEIENTH